MSITGEPGGQPQKSGVAITDIFTGVYAVSGILAGGAISATRRAKGSTSTWRCWMWQRGRDREPSDELSRDG